MNEEHIQLLIDLHQSNNRQGPGSEQATKKALIMAGLNHLNQSAPLKILDIGCGTGASTIQLAQALDAQIIAVDMLPAFLQVLEARANDHGVADKVSTVCCSMDNLAFDDESFDVIWAEGAIYNMGFAAGVAAWRRLLKPGGKLIVSEITWLTAKRPTALQRHWENEYAEVDLASAKINILEQNGYTPEGYFYLPKQCWVENYYTPIQNQFDAFLERNGQSDLALEIVQSEKAEIALYEKYQDYYSYGVYIAKKI